MKHSLRFYIYAALMASLTFVATYLPKIPIPATQGYVHLGDSIIVASSMLFGPLIGCLTGTIGSSFADLAGGYIIYILPTFLIKGIMGLVIGKFCFRFEKLNIKVITGLILGGLVLIGGYYIAEVIIYSNFITPVASLGFNLLQYLFGAVVGTLLYKAMKNIKI